MNEVMFQAWKAYRKANPRSRAPGAIIYVKNTAKTKRQGCVLCGARGPSWAAEWRKTRAAETWEAEHDCSEHILRETYNPTLAFKRLVTEANR